MILEVCIDSVEAARAAEAGGAQRVELCGDLMEGGITPSAGLIERVRKTVAIGVFTMVRPRGGDFCYSADELDVMRKDIAIAKASGADGVVLGLLLPDGTVDVERTRELVERARPMLVTFHRAIDVSSNLLDSLERAIEAGADRVLTSGGKDAALAGAKVIARMVAAARGRIAVMAGAGVKVENLAAIAEATGAREFHASLRKKTASPMKYRPAGPNMGAPGLDEYARYATSPDDVQAMRRVLDALEVRSSASQPG